MILVDTSVWIGHFRARSPRLAGYLEQGVVLVHPFVAGELACGNLKHRAAVLELFAALPPAAAASDAEVLNLIEGARLWRRGIGWIDAHLLASALLSEAALWTLDARLAAAARLAGVASPVPPRH